MISSATSEIDCLSEALTRTRTAGWPLTVVMMFWSTNPSRIVAMSPSDTIVPSSFVMSGMSSNSVPTVRLATVCRTTPPAWVRSSPNVRFREARRTVCDTSLRERPLRRNSSSLNSMVISRSRVPLSTTWEMDGRASSSSRTSSAAYRNRLSETDDDETASVTTSRAVRMSSTCGRSATAGGKFSIPPTAFLTSSSTVSPSAKVANSISTRARPSVATATTRSTPDSPTTLSSMRRLMSSSISLGDEPGDGTVTSTLRRSSSGEC